MSIRTDISRYKISVLINLFFLIDLFFLTNFLHEAALNAIYQPDFSKKKKFSKKSEN